MKSIVLVLLSPIIVLVSGCITNNPKVTVDDTAKYQNPQAFMEDRLAQGVFGFSKTKLLDDGTIVYDASFTDMNTRYLRKPSEDAKGYCLAKNGQWKHVSAMGYQAGSPGKVLSRDLTEIERLGARQGSSQEAIQAAKEKTIRRVQNQYNHSGMSGAQKLINKAENNGYLGEFTCMSDTETWNITIRPMDLKLADPRNQLTTHKLTIHVSVNE